MTGTGLLESPIPAFGLFCTVLLLFPQKVHEGWIKGGGAWRPIAFGLSVFVLLFLSSLEVALIMREVGRGEVSGRPWVRVAEGFTDYGLLDGLWWIAIELILIPWLFFLPAHLYAGSVKSTMERAEPYWRLDRYVTNEEFSRMELDGEERVGSFLEDRVLLEKKVFPPTPKRPLWPYVLNLLFGLVLSFPHNPIYRLIDSYARTSPGVPLG